MLYSYNKAQPGKSKYITSAPIPLTPLRRKAFATVSMFLFLVGFFVLGQVVYPIFAWYLFTLPTYSTGVASPLASNFHPENSPIFPTIVHAAEVVSPNKIDSFDTSHWFVGAGDVTSTTTFTKTYTLTIPKLKIDSAVVILGDDVDLKKSLVAWGTSAPPGAYGNNIIFGHSELPQFASPKKYDGIFTHIMDLVEGDQIIVDYDSVRYEYSVIYKKVVAPTDISVLEQRFDDSYISLITCVPPGTIWMRGVVVARLTKI